MTSPRDPVPGLGREGAREGVLEPATAARATTPGASPSVMARADAPEVVSRVHEGMTLVEIIANQLRRELGGRVVHGDLVSFGQEGLLSAARTFDASLGVPFRRWANYRIRGAMLDGVRSSSMLPRSVYARVRALESGHRTAEAAAEDGTAQPTKSAEDADARLATYLAGIATAIAIGVLGTAGEAMGEGIDPALPADEILARNETLAAVREAMQALPEQERHHVQRHYVDDVQFDEAAREIGLSKSWGSRLHGRAIESITRHLKRTHALR